MPSYRQNVGSSSRHAHQAIFSGEFSPCFQPLVTLRTGELQGFELLARWNHPQRGLISPDEFIPIAEKEGWIDLLLDEMLRAGFAAIAVLPEPFTLAVNISPFQLRNPNLPKQIRSIAGIAGFSTERLIVEITESSLLNHPEHAQAVAQELKSMGCKLALDDFGTGYSSLAHLQSLPFDILKVDRSFVGAMVQQRESRKIVAALVGLGQSLGLTTVAEGVEIREQAEMLLWLGCELGQGWLYGKPIPAAELPQMVSDHRPSAARSLLQESMGHLSSTNLDWPPAQRLAQLQAVYDGAPVGLAFLDSSLIYKNINRTLAEMNGRPVEAHLGRTVAEMIPAQFSMVEPYIRRALRGESISSVEITKPPSGPNAGRIILLSYEPARDEAGEVIGVSVAMMDMTSLRQAEQARRETEDNFRHMIELLPQIPWIIDSEGRALDVSQRWLELTGMTDDQWRGYGWLNALHPDDVQPTWDEMYRAFADGRPIDIIYRVRRPGGEWKRLRSRGAARVGADGKILCWYGCLEVLDEALDEPSDDKT